MSLCLNQDATGSLGFDELFLPSDGGLEVAGNFPQGLAAADLHVLRALVHQVPPPVAESLIDGWQTPVIVFHELGRDVVHVHGVGAP